MQDMVWVGGLSPGEVNYTMTGAFEQTRAWKSISKNKFTPFSCLFQII